MLAPSFSALMTAIACLLIAFGTWMDFRQKSREHRRLNQLGVEVFLTYPSKLRAKTAGAARWLKVATLVSAGVVVLPLYGLLLYGMWT